MDRLGLNITAALYNFSLPFNRLCSLYNVIKRNEVNKFSTGTVFISSTDYKTIFQNLPDSCNVENIVHDEVVITETTDGIRRILGVPVAVGDMPANNGIIRVLRNNTTWFSF